jgi:MFS family permease
VLEPGIREIGSHVLTRPIRALTGFVCALVLIDIMLGTALTPLLPHYMRVAGLSKPEAGILVAAFPFGSLVSALPGGALAARFGSRAVVLAGLALMGAATLAFGWASAPAALEGARFVQGGAGACTWAAGLAWLGTAERRGELLGTAMGGLLRAERCSVRSSE